MKEVFRAQGLEEYNSRLVKFSLLCNHFPQSSIYSKMMMQPTYFTPLLKSD